MREIRSVFSTDDAERQTIEEVGKVLARLFRKQYEMIGERLKGMGITDLQSVILINIYHFPGINQNQLAEFIAMDKATISRMLHNLEPKGFIIREANESDRRFNKLYLTPSGEQIVQQNLNNNVNLWLEVLNGIPLERFTQFLDSLNLILERFESFNDSKS